VTLLEEQGWKIVYYLIYLKVCTIQWEYFSVCCSARYLLWNKVVLNYS